MSGETLTLEGTVLGQERGDVWEVEVVVGAQRRRVLARRSGRLNLNRIRLVVGDRVTVEISPYDPNRGRITYRH